MPVWHFFDYVETTGRNKIREWLDGLSDEDQAKIDIRLFTMAAQRRWPEKWVSKYHGVDDLFEFRITGNRVQYRPLGTYYGGAMSYVLLAGAVEKGGKIPKSDVETAERRLSNLRSNTADVVPHEFDDPGPLEEDAQ